MTRINALWWTILGFCSIPATLAAHELSLDMIGEWVKPVGVAIAPDGERVLVRWQQRGVMEYHRKPSHYEVLTRQGQRQGLLKEEGGSFADGAWRPDGASIAVVATREGKSSLELWDPGAGADTTPIEACREGERAVAPTWSPDGRRIALYCAKGADPGAAAEKPAPPKVLLASEGDLFGMEPVSPAAESRVLVIDLETGQSRELAAGQSLLPSGDTLIWLGERTLMVVASNPGGDAGFAWSRQRNGTVYDLDARSAEPFASQWEGSHIPLFIEHEGQPALLHPVGGGRKRIAAIEGFNTHHAFQLQLGDASGSRTVLEASPDWFVPAGDAEHPLSYFRHFHADGTYYFPRFERGSRIVVSHRIGSGEVVDLTQPDVNVADFSVGTDGASMVTLQGDHNTPEDVYWHDLRNAGSAPVDPVPRDRPVEVCAGRGAEAEVAKRRRPVRRGRVAVAAAWPCRGQAISADRRYPWRPRRGLPQ